MPSLERLEKLLSAEPNDPFVLYAIAQEHAKAGRHAEAIVHYDRCLGADAGYCYAYFHKSRSQLAAGDAQGAAATLRAGLVAARRTGDEKAASEIHAALEAMDDGGHGGA